jgi:hypothetical protein
MRDVMKKAKVSHTEARPLPRSGSAKISTALHVSAFVALVSGVNAASASPEFPAELQSVVEMDCRPACTVCHTSNPGTNGTATQPFALSMKEAGLKAADVDSVAVAYNALPEDVDSDGDGSTDQEELTRGGVSDPNVDDPATDLDGSPCAAEVRYGCSSHAAQPPLSSHLGWVFLIALGGLTVFGRRAFVRVRARR